MDNKCFCSNKQMSFRETSHTVASGRLVVVNGAEAVTGFPLRAPNGSATLPSFSFESETNTGIYLTSTGNMTIVTGGRDAVVMSPGSNVALLGGGPATYGNIIPGVGVTYLNASSTAPTGAPNGGSGGLLWVDGLEIKYTNSLGVATSLNKSTGDVAGPAGAVDGTLARYTGTSGKFIESSGVAPLLLAQADVPGAPTYSFVSDATTGMYNPGADNLAFSTGGVRRLNVSTTGVTSDGVIKLIDGTLAAPSVAFDGGGGLFLTSGNIAFFSGSEIGMSVGPNANVTFGGYPPANLGSIVNGSGVVFINEVGVAPTGATTGGVSLWVAGAALMMMTTASATPIDLIGRIEGPASAIGNAVVRFDGTSGALVKSTGQVVVADTGEVAGGTGSVGAPTYAFASDTSTGMYSAAANTLNFSILGAMTTSCGTTSITSTSNILCPAGTEAAPGMSWVGDSDTGFYLAGGVSVASTSGNATGFVASPDANITLCGTEASSYGGGEGVIFLRQASVNATGTATDIGLLYVPTGSVNDLVFYDDSPGPTTLTNRISGPLTSTNRGVLRWDGATGKIVQDSVVTITPSGEVLAPDGTLAAPTYTTAGDPNTGLTTVATDTLNFVAGGVSVLEVSTLGVTLLQVVDVPDGTVGAPSFTFASDLGCGVFHPATADTLTLVGGGTAGLTTVLAGAAPNVTLVSTNTDYGAATSGEGVLLIDNVTVPPSGTATGGARIYVSGTSLIFHADSNHVVNLSTEFIPSIGASVDRAVVRFDGTTGAVQESSFRINDPTALDYPVVGSTAAPTFSFTSDPTSGVYWSSSNSVGISTGGVDRITMSSTAVTIPSQAFQVDTTLRVGGSSGVTHSRSTTKIISNVATASTGAFAWSNNTGAIMNTTANLNLALTNNLVETNGIRVLTVGYDGAAFAVASTGTITSFDFKGGTNQLKVGTTTGCTQTSGTTTITNRMMVVGVNTASPDSDSLDYRFHFVSRGLWLASDDALAVSFGVNPPLGFYKNNCVAWGGLPTIGDSVSGVIFLYDVSTIPSSTQNDAITLYMERASGVFGLGGYTTSQDRTVLDGARERATITLGALSVTHATSTNTDGLTWASLDDYGVNGTLTGEMSTSDDCIALFTATAEWASNSTGYRRLSIMRKTIIGPVYTELNSVTTMSVNGEVTCQTVSFLGNFINATNQLTVQVYQDSTIALNVDLTASFVRYDTLE